MTMRSAKSTGALLLTLIAGTVLLATTARAADFTVTGVFQYEDRIFDKFGYTGTAQNLPIRHADVEVVKDQGQGTVLATGSTDANGAFSILVTGQGGQLDLYVRCYSSSNNSSVYHVTASANSGGSAPHVIVTATESNHNTNQDLDVGTWVIADATGSGIAQAFNIFDCGIDAFDYLATASGIGRYPTAGEGVIYWWDGTSGGNGSYYTGSFVSITGSGTDTDGWSDTVILHESGHWASHRFGNDDNPGGQHFIGDNVQDPRLSYGEGYATFFCAQVREFRAPRLNPLGNPVDDNVSIYADLEIPPSLPTPGGLGFAYDFETGLFENGVPIGQIGSANETNVTSAMWDMVDGTTTRDGSPGVDDEPGDETGALSWDVIQNYMTTLGGAPEPITVEDFYQGWFIRHGAGFLQAEMESAYVGLAGMPFALDAYEPDDTPATAKVAAPVNYGLGGLVVINEIDQGGEDKVEIYNGTASPVDLTGWRLTGYQGATTPILHNFTAYTLDPGSHLVVHENGNSGNDIPGHVYTGQNWVWANGGDGAVTLQNNLLSPVDFVRWGGSTQAIPLGTSFTGSVGSSPAGQNLGRDRNGTDTDDASDFAFQIGTMSAPNAPDSYQTHTIFPEADADLVLLESAAAGSVFVMRAESPHSAGSLVIDVLDKNGVFLGSQGSLPSIPTLTEIQFLASGDSVYFRVRNNAPYTQFAAAQVLIFKRPISQILGPPVGLSASAANAGDVGDAVSLLWLNGGIYDSVRVYREGGLIATLPGADADYTDFVNRGAYTYEVAGLVGAVETARVSASVFAGLLECFVDEGWEAGDADWDLDSPWARTNTIASTGSWSLRDSPNDYGNNLNISATLLVPMRLLASPTLEFDHICITEATWDFGILEISKDFGSSWSELARYDMDDHPGWNDGVPGAGDWVHEIVDLNDYVGEKIQIRFRLETDTNTVEDGWFIDNVQISNSSCQSVTGVDEELLPRPSALLRVAGPNPFRSQIRMTLAAKPGTRARVHVFDTQGRLVRTLFSGEVSSPESHLTWDGRDGTGRTSAAGFYLLRAVTDTRQAVSRVVKLN